MCGCAAVCDAGADSAKLVLDVWRRQGRCRHVGIWRVRQRSVGGFAAAVGRVLGGVRLRWRIMAVSVLVRRRRVRGSYQARSWVSHFRSFVKRVRSNMTTSLKDDKGLCAPALESGTTLSDHNGRQLSDLATHWDGSKNTAMQARWHQTDSTQGLMPSQSNSKDDETKGRYHAKPRMGRKEGKRTGTL